MATTAWRHPGTISSQTRTGGAVSWLTPENAGASDNVYATCSLAMNGSHWLWCTNFGFDTSMIPSGAVVLGREVKWERKVTYGLATEGTLSRTYYKAIKGGIEVGTQKTADGDLPTSDTESTVEGSASDLWGTAWTDTEARASNSGVAIAYFVDLYVTAAVSADDVQMRWHYSLAGKGKMFMVL